MEKRGEISQTNFFQSNKLLLLVLQSIHRINKYKIFSNVSLKSQQI